MTTNLLDFACAQRGRARSLASLYVRKYDGDALALARMARNDNEQQGNEERRSLYSAVIGILELR